MRESNAEAPVRAFAFNVVKRLAALLLPLGFGLGEFLQTAKGAFVAAAAEHIAARGDRVSTSRIAALTGLSRADVSKIRSNRSNDPRGAGKQRTARVMHGWFSDREFVDSNGNPKPLRLDASSSFERLVRRFSGDVPPRAILQELLAAGMAELDPDGQVRPIRRHAMAVGRSIDLDGLAADLGVFLKGASEETSETSGSVRRVSVLFGRQMPTAVRRNATLRTERFLEAMSEYLHTAAAASNTASGSGSESATFHVVVAQSEFGTKPSPDDHSEK
jgi:hypothetical protein